MSDDDGRDSSPEHVQYSLHLTNPLKGAVELLAARQFKTPQCLMENLLLEEVVEERGVLTELERQRMTAEVALFRRIDEILKQLRRLDRWDEHVTRMVVETIERDHLPLYELAIGGDAYQNGNTTKNRINKQIGARVKEGLQATIKATRRGGPPLKGSVTKGLIRTYTKLWRSSR